MPLRYLACVAAALVLACGADESPPFGGFGGGGADTIQMVPGTQPTYGWNGGNADTIDVARTTDLSTPVWRAVSVDLDGIASGVTHGTTGADRSVKVSTETVLTSGIQYRVRVVRLSGSSAITKTFTVP